MSDTFGELQDRQLYTGSLDQLASLLRQIPTYQIDKNHFHCGPRSRLEPALVLLRPLSNAGICLSCWRNNRAEDSWLENPTGRKWYFGMPKSKKCFDECQDHQSAKVMYTAEERDWTPTMV